MKFNILILFYSLLYIAPTAAVSLSNDNIQLKLDVTPGSQLIITKAVSLTDGGIIFQHKAPFYFMENWGPQELRTSARKNVRWSVESNDLFERAHFSLDLKNGLRRTHIVELAKQGTLFRISMTLENNDADSVHVDWYPVWKTTWEIPGGGEWLKSWEALTYKPFQTGLHVDAQTVLGFNKSKVDHNLKDTEGADCR